jgi:signal transduction histidine kinase
MRWTQCVTYRIDRVRWMSKSELHAPDGVLITFKDTGTGITAKDAERIFAPFVTTKSTGMGMGLAICRSIVEAHGGRIWVTPGDLHGSAFRVLLPAADPVSRSVAFGCFALRCTGY